MKRLSLLFLLALSPASAEPPDNAKPVTVIKSYKDVDLKSDYAPSLQIVVEKYMLLGAYSDDTFRPTQPLTRGELAGWLDRAASRAEQLIDIVADDFKGDKAAFRTNSYPDAHQPDALKNFAKLEDLPDTDPYYKAPQHLAEHFHLFMKGANGFNPLQPVTAKEYSTYLRALFAYKGGPQGDKPITRADALDAYCDAFQFYLDRVESQMINKMP